TAAETPADGSPDRLPALLKLVVIFVAAVLTALLGAVLRGMVVTFPYSGVLVAVEARRQLAEFSRHFARNSLALVGFLAAYHYLQDVSPVVALGAGWVAFAVVAVALHLPLHLPLRPRRGRAGRVGEPPAETPAAGGRATSGALRAPIDRCRPARRRGSTVRRTRASPGRRH
ncbi:hypothetical protein, partial [Micromonospora tarensis]